ncbi:error-prone DNA polymerase [Methylobacterium dankookense]|uniref:Error-prone DNA polymerase n=1 Tax=Methylobacterium dankookense TaxID=560405 RepID=A0A564FZV5_9HYPH|nr:error-prone DNA polymerase [Methylobacterium dankookense]GJD59283.1 Error-prone DNA polymerase [Methylobacterium dankookense]VUF13384.1 Error-prone DNA polymerase [Methylobacterium dankookense]
MSGPYAELAVSTNFSFLRGASHPQDYVEQAILYGLHAIGIADRNTTAGLVRAYAAARVKPDKARKAGDPEHWKIRFLPGMRLVTECGFEAIAYPMDRAAYGRLCRLLSAGNRRARKGECLFSLREMLAHAEGQVFIAMPPAGLIMPPAGLIMPPAGLEMPEDFLAATRKLAAAAPGRTFLAGSHARRGDERVRLARLAETGDRLGAPMVAVSDALYHHPARRPLQDVLACIREGCTLAEAGYRLEANAERHLKPADEMARLFADHPEAIARTVEIAESCTFSLGELAYEYPDEPVPPGRSPQEYLEDRTFHHAGWRFPGGIPPEIEATLREELRLIAKMDYARYFLTLYEVVAFARSRGILCQGRGSAANSAVCYCLGITAVDPTEIRLLFARFISENRGEPPDIDVDFEHERREEVIQHLYDKYGRERAAICATVIHYRPRSAIREVGKVLGLTEDLTAALADTVWGSWGKDLPDAHIVQAGLDPGNPLIRQAVDLATALIGFPRHLSQHVGGFVLTRHRLDETVPIGNAAMPGRTFIEWDKDDIDVVGLMKVDVLALGMLTCLKRGLDFLERDYGRAYPTLADLPQGDCEVYAMLARADSVGVFQVESRAQMAMLPRLRPREFYDLVVQVAIVRPGPIQGDMVHPYLRRRCGAEPVTYPAPHPDHGPANELHALLHKTYGVPLFQEHAMQIAITAAGFTPAEADGLRRAMATFRHVGTIGSYEAKFIGGMTGRGYPRDFAERCFAQIRGFSTYGFPESHAASFALLVYASAWLKCRHPDVFLAAILNAQPMGFYQPAQLVRDARAHGVEVRRVDVNASHWDCTLEPASGRPPPGVERRMAVRLGLRLVSGLSEAAMRRLVERRGNGYASIEGLQAALALPRHALERLAEADAFRSLDLDRRAAQWAVRTLEGGPLRDPVRGTVGGAVAADERRAQGLAAPLPLFALHADDGLFRHEPAVDLPAMPLPEAVAEDYTATGLSLQGHPVAFFRERLTRIGVIPARAHLDRDNGARASVAGLVLTRQRPGTAKGVVFLTLEDETGIANVIVWRKVFEANRRAAMTARFLAVQGRVQRAGAVVHLIAERFRDLTEELRALREGGVRLPPETTDFDAPVDRRVFRSRDFH